MLLSDLFENDDLFSLEAKIETLSVGKIVLKVAKELYPGVKFVRDPDEDSVIGPDGFLVFAMPAAQIVDGELYVGPYIQDAYTKQYKGILVRAIPLIIATIQKRLKGKGKPAIIVGSDESGGVWEKMAAKIGAKYIDQSQIDQMNEGPMWDKIKKTATAAGLAGAVGYGALSGQLTGKDEPARAPIEIDIPGGDIEQQKPEVKKEKVKLEKSTATNANPEMEKIVFLTAFRSGIKGKELAQFMAQVAHETLGFQHLVEVGDKKYFNRYDPKFSPQKAKILGNVKAGDGLRYKGRGFIQITGRDNYRKAGKALGIDLENNPKWASDPKIAAKIAVWYWQNRVKPAVDDYTDTIGVTAKINPSMNGLGDRDMNFHYYLQKLNLE